MDNQLSETIELIISVVALAFSSISIITSLLIYLSTRASVCNQIYSRWQALLLAQDDKTTAFLKDTKFDEKAPQEKAHYIAIAYLNLYEEAFFYHNTKVLGLFSMLPETLWQSIQRSMKVQLNERKYLETMWKERYTSYSNDFVGHVQGNILFDRDRRIQTSKDDQN